MPRTISMLMLGVASLAESVPFYRDVVELELERQFGGLAFFKAGGIQLLLSEDLGRAVEPRNGAAEVIFPAGSVHAEFEALSAQGCQFLREPKVVTPGFYAATFRDPDGHLLTLFGPR
ncbi:MAG: VOC family protein [Acidobacteria bacterium]|nr:VOC family protein [Acidobacteriota bacterium]